MISFLATQLPRHATQIVRYLRRCACAGPILNLIPSLSLSLSPSLRFECVCVCSLRFRCSSSPRLIALISSDSDYCCLRIVQLMCELRHRLRNKQKKKTKTPEEKRSKRSRNAIAIVNANEKQNEIEAQDRDLYHLGCQRQAAFAVSIYSRAARF